MTAAELLDAIAVPLAADPSFPPGWFGGYLARRRPGLLKLIEEHIFHGSCCSSCAAGASCESACTGEACDVAEPEHEQEARADEEETRLEQSVEDDDDDEIPDPAGPAARRFKAIQQELRRVRGPLSRLITRAKEEGVWRDYLLGRPSKSQAKDRIRRELSQGPGGLRELRDRLWELERELVEAAPLLTAAQVAALNLSPTKVKLLNRIIERPVEVGDFEVRAGNLAVLKAAGYIVQQGKPRQYVATAAGIAAAEARRPKRRTLPELPPAPTRGPAQVRLSEPTAELLRYVSEQLRTPGSREPFYHAPAAGTVPRDSLLVVRGLLARRPSSEEARAALLALDQELSTGTPADKPLLRCGFPGCSEFRTIDNLTRTTGAGELVLCEKHGGSARPAAPAPPPPTRTPPPRPAETETPAPPPPPPMAPAAPGVAPRRPSAGGDPLRFQQCGGSLCVTTAGDLPRRRFNEYVALMKNLREVYRGRYAEEWNGERNANVFALDKTSEIYEQLVKAGFAPQGTGTVPGPSRAKPRIRLSLAHGGDAIKVSLVDRLGEDGYWKYKDILEGAIATPIKTDAGAYLVEPELINGVGNLLTAQGWEVEGDAATKEVLARVERALAEEARVYRQKEAAAAQYIDRRIAALAQMGIAVPDYQREGALWLASHGAAVLGDVMGLGKTMQILLALPPGAAAVVFGKVAAKRAFREDVPRFRRLRLPGDPDPELIFLKGTAGFRWPQPGQILVGSWASLPEANKATPPPLGVILIADEAHELKNPKATRTQRFRALSRAVLHAAHGRVYQLTGSPYKNPKADAKVVSKDLWELLENAELGTARYGTIKRFDALSGKPEGNRLLASAMLRRDRSVLKSSVQLLHQTIPVDLAVEAARVLDAAMPFLEEFEQGVIQQAIQLSVERRRVVFAEISKARKTLAVAKIPAMVEIVEEHEEEGEPLLVFSAHLEPVQLLEKRPGWAAIHGGTSEARRDQIVTAFQQGKYKGLALTIGAGGTSLNLTYAHYALFVDQDWTTAGNDQAEYRILRFTQTRDCIIKILVANHPMDQRVQALLAFKQREIAKALGKVSADLSLAQKPTEPVAINLAAPRDFNRPQPPQPPPPPPPSYAPTRGSSSSASSDGGGASGRAAAAPTPWGRSEPAAAPTPGRRGRHPAETPLEQWAANAVVQLTAMDPDKAGLINMAGWNSTDGEFGASLAAQLQRGGGLTDKQWEMAIKISRKYHRQIGAPPDAPPKVKKTRAKAKPMKASA